MAKGSKNTAKHTGKTITDYFSRRPVQSKPSQSSTERQSRPANATSRADHQKTATSSSPESSPPSSTSGQANHPTASRTKGMQEHTSPQITESLRARSSTRSSTPEGRSSNSSSRMLNPVSPMRPSEKRKAKFGIDVDAELAESVLYISRGGPTCSSNDSISTLPTPLSPRENLTSPLPSRRDTRRKLRFSSPESELDEVPGSQSDEVEMMPLVLEPCNETNTDQWRQTTSFDSDPPAPMDIDVFHTPKLAVADTSNDSADSTLPFRQPLTPPPTCPVQETTTGTSPVLDQATKTAQVIARIRARAEARAATNSSPENAPIQFKEELSDSESEEELLSPIKINRQGKGKSAPAEARYNFRGPAALASSSRRTISPNRDLPRRVETKKKKANPLDALLKEKQKDDRRGAGVEALERAKKALAGKDRLLSELDDEDNQKWQDENAAREAVQQHERSEYHSSSPTKETDIEDVDLDEIVGNRLFGDEKGEAIRSNITSEREQRNAVRLRESCVGIPLWTKHRNASSFTDDTRPSYDFGETECPILCRLKHAIDHDASQLVFLLNAGVLSRLELRNQPGIIECLCHLALSADGDERSCCAAYRALLNRWNSPTASAPGIALRTCIDAIVQMGADPDKLGLSDVQSAAFKPIGSHEREALLFRLVSLVTLSARSQIIEFEDIPNIIPILLAISLDSSTSTVLKTDITVAVDTMCRSIADGDTLSPKLEAAICTKILEYIANFDPVNKSFVVSLIARGSGRSTRIARWVARSVLLGQRTVREKDYCHLPSLNELAACLTPTSPKCTVFRVDQGTDYIDMGFYTNILATALSDFPTYVKEEMAASKSAKLRSPSKFDKQEAASEHIRSCIDFIYSKIGDTQGSHLERTRAKASLKTLSFRVAYQRIAVSKSGQNNGRPKNIKQYFKKR